MHQVDIVMSFSASEAVLDEGFSSHVTTSQASPHMNDAHIMLFMYILQRMSLNTLFFHYPILSPFNLHSCGGITAFPNACDVWPLLNFISNTGTLQHM